MKVVQSNPQIQDMITSWITNLEGLYKNDPATDDGYVVKIPLDPIVKVNCKSFNALVSEVYILIPENEPPCYLIFDENKLLSFVFNGDINKLSNILDFNLRNKDDKDVYKFALTNSIYNLDNAYHKFFKAHTDFPKFKSKHDYNYSYTTKAKISNEESNIV
ncbi:hypothetical protein [Clostridium estertheticum]|uniref:hypothetical protein n=1 Tax=Clostridium estertheticum TaxID=238834 RepID=UPI00398D40B6